MSTGFCAFVVYMFDLHPGCFIIVCLDQKSTGVERLTPRIAGSLGTCGGGGGLFSLGGSSIRRSFTSLPRKTMYSYTLSLPVISSSGLLRRPSVPKDVTFSKATVEFSELIS